MGIYDNEAGRYIPSDNWENGQWLITNDGRLHIIPVGGDGIEGPDDEDSDLILQALGGNERLDEHDIQRLGLTEVHDVLKRFDPTIGYYSA